MQSTRRGRFSVHRSEKKPRFQIQFDKRPLSPGTSREAGRMDFEFETMHAELVSAIENAINREVAADREVRVANLPREEAFQIPDLIRTKISLLPPDIAQVRTVEIVGLDLQA